MRTHLNLTRAIFAIGMAGCFGIAQAQSSTPNQGTQTGSQTGTQSGQSSQGAAGQRSGTGTQDHSQHTAGQSTTGQGTAGQGTAGQGTAGRSNTSGDRSHSGASGTTTGARAGTTAGAEGSELMVGKQDHQFLVDAAQSNMMEIHMAQMAQQKATSDEVKQYAKQLEQDHTAAGQKLKELAAQKNVQLPTEMGAKHQSHMSKFQAMSDAQFERAWLKNQVQHHKKDVNSFQKQVNRSMDSDVKEFAQNTLPKLQEHLQQAQQLNTNTGTRARSNDRANTQGTGASNDRSGAGTSNTQGTGTSNDRSGAGTSNSQGTTDANRTNGQNNPSTRK